MNSSMPRSIRDGEWKSNLRHNCSDLVLKATAIIWHRAPPGLKSSNSRAGNFVNVGLLTCFPKVSLDHTKLNHSIKLANTHLLKLKHCASESRQMLVSWRLRLCVLWWALIRITLFCVSFCNTFLQFFSNHCLTLSNFATVSLAS